MLEDLLKGAADSKETEPQVPPGDSQAFDWSRPSYFSPRQMDHLEACFNRCAEALSERLAREFSAEVSAQVTSVAQRHYGGFARDAAEGTFVFALTCQQDLPPGTLVVPAPLGLAWIERLLGGTEPGEEASPNLSALDRSLLVTASAWSVETVCQTLKQPDFPVYRLEEGGAVDRGADADEIVVAQMKLDGQVGAGTLMVAFPVAALEALCADAEPAQGWSPPAVEDSEADKERIRAALEAIPIELSVRLGQGELTLEEIIGLEPGDVVVLDRRTDEEIELEVAGASKLAGLAGRSSGKYALQITQVK